MSVGRKSMKYAAAAVIVAAAIIAASTLYLGVPYPSSQSSSSALAGQSTLAIWLTDPPQVPHLTSSLNLTYSSLTLLVGEPTGASGQLTTKSVTVTPSGGSTTVDLLRLQNVSQTIALASLPDNSVVYSVTFAVSSIKIDINGTISSVSLATGGSSFSVTMDGPSALSGGDSALLQLNPVVVDTPSGYQMIPSAVGVMRHSQGEGGDQVGNQHQLTNQDSQDLEHARGNVTASLLALSVSGDVTTVTVRVSNTGTVPVQLMGLGLHGNFTMTGSPCQNSGSTTTTTTSTTTESHDTETHTTATHTEVTNSEHRCETPEHADQVVFVPLVPGSSTSTTSTTTSSTASGSCSAGSMTLVNGEAEGDHGGLTLNAGQCVDLTFTGQLGFGGAHFVLVPSTLAGQAYVLHAIASGGANGQFTCVLPLGPKSCSALPQQSEQQD